MHSSAKRMHLIFAKNDYFNSLRQFPDNMRNFRTIFSPAEFFIAFVLERNNTAVVNNL